jgi:hypothetical protein
MNEENYNIKDEENNEVVTYTIPQSETVFVNPDTHEVIDNVSLTPMQKIRQACKMSNIEISEPYKGCNSCYGQGYTSVMVSNGRPIVCKCLFRHLPKTERDNQYSMLGSLRTYNRKERRAMERNQYRK